MTRPVVRLVVATCCAAAIAGLSLVIVRQLTTDDPRAAVRTPTGYDLGCDACGHGWHVDHADWRVAFEGQEPSPHLTVACPECGKRAGRLLDPCPWCRRPLPRNTESRLCPSCGKNPDEWKAVR